MPGNADPYLIESAAKVLDVLELFRRTGARLTLGDVAAKLSLPKSTAFRLLYTLESKGCLQRIPDTYFYRMCERRQIGLATASPWIRIRGRDNARLAWGGVALWRRSPDRQQRA